MNSINGPKSVNKIQSYQNNIQITPNSVIIGATEAAKQKRKRKVNAFIQYFRSSLRNSLTLQIDSIQTWILVCFTLIAFGIVIALTVFIALDK